MPLDWSSFEGLPGDSRINFENLCRGIVRQHWGKSGHFQALKNQPGVEFHLKINKDGCPLGDTGRWYGWQCKKFDITKGGDLTAASKRSIEESLRKTEEKLPKITDWVLWTPFTLSKKDQKWFCGLKSSYELHLWAEEEVNNYLSDTALFLRSTYFGELIVTPDDLKKQHDISIAPIAKRWMNPAHQKTEVERTLRRMLGEPGSWADVTELGEELSSAATLIEDFIINTPELDADKRKFAGTCRTISEMLLQFHAMLAEGDMDILQQWLRDIPSLLTVDIFKFVGALRKRNISLALEATNALDDMRQAIAALGEVADYLNTGIVAVLADAGGGKTHLAAQLTSPQEKRPAGVLLHGKTLHKGQSQNDFARHFSINGSPVDSMEKLLASVDAAAKRACCRLPIIIDGLNEAENPKEWKRVLASIQVLVKNYPNVLIICTLRTGEHSRDRWPNVRHGSETRETFAVQALPDGIEKLECEGFGEDFLPAFRKYCQYYKIEVEKGTELPAGFLKHPLNLRIFCDITNQERQGVVNINHFPSSFASLFDEYIRRAVARISEMENVSLSEQNVNDALYRLGMYLWDSNRREIGEDDFVKAVHQVTPDWNQNIVSLLVQEGIIFKNPAEEPGSYVVTPVYDALGGHIIASALLKKEEGDREFRWLTEALSVGRFGGETSHALSQDILMSLVALVPARIPRDQLWRRLPEGELRTEALLLTMYLDAKALDEETVEQISALAKLPEHQQKIFDRLWKETKGATDHPLNADFLEQILRDMDMPERDLSWTEWVRRDEKSLAKEISGLEKRWQQDQNSRPLSDCLRAKALSWVLTTTSHSLRNAATRALYWFGRGKPETLFELTADALSINDPYVPERLLAASYGVAMASSKKFSGGDLFAGQTLTKFAGEIFEHMFSSGGQYKTTHELTRDFAARIIELAEYHNPGFFAVEDIKLTVAPFRTEGLPVWGEAYIQDNGKISNKEKKPSFFTKYAKKIKPRLLKILPKKIEDLIWTKRVYVMNQSPFEMDFENYTIGGLVPDRGNYNYDHAEYRKVRAQLLWRVFQLGWSYDKFESVEKNIMHRQDWWHGRQERPKTDRYGKKYSWIAYHEMAGLLRDKGVLKNEHDWWRVAPDNIDPSFMSEFHSPPLEMDSFLGDNSQSTQNWIQNGKTPDVMPYLKEAAPENGDSDWIMLDGYVNQSNNKDGGREIFFFVRSFLVSAEDEENILDLLNNEHELGDGIPDKPNLYNVYCGEVPWSETFKDYSSFKWSITVGEKKVVKKLPVSPVVVRDDGSISFVKSERFEEREVVEYEYANFHAIIPVCDIKSDVATDSTGRITTLSKGLAMEMDLIGQPQSPNLYLKSGKQATRYISYNPDDYKNSHKMFYVKEDILQKYLKERGLSLIWVIWGERRYSFDGWRMTHDNLPEPRYSAFRDIQSYD